MKTSKNLFYSGLALVLSPILLLIILWWISAKVEGYNDDKKIQKEKKVVYDTVRVKVTDTVVIQKIKYIKKVEPVSSDSISK